MKVTSSRMPAALALIGLVAAAAVLAACGGGAEPTPLPTATPAPTSTPLPPTPTPLPPTPTPVPTPLPTPKESAVQPPASVGDMVDAMVAGATWGDLYGGFSASERACLDDALGDELLAWVLDEPVLSDDEPPADVSGGRDSSEWGPKAYACLPPQLVAAVFIGGMVAETGVEVGGLTAAEESCLEDMFSRVDWSDIALSPEPDGQILAFSMGVWGCVPDKFVAGVLAGTDDMDAGSQEVTPEQAACLVEWLTGTDWGAATSEEAISESMMEAMFGCVLGMMEGGMLEDLVPPGGGPGLVSADAVRIEVGGPVQGSLDSGETDFYAFDAVEGEFYQIDVALGTLEDSWVELYDADEWAVAYSDDRGDSLASRIVWRAESTGEMFVGVGGYGEGTYTLTVSAGDIEDDHANTAAGASPVASGEPVDGSIDYEGDVDYFAFDATEGEYYQVDVALGTLSDSWAELYGDEGRSLEFNDDHGDSFESRIVWQAEATGRLHVAVGGYGTGTYTLAVSVPDVDDDHANSAGGASPAASGEPVSGSIDYEGDVDYFAFDATEGEFYQVDVALGTLPDSLVELYGDEDDWPIEFNDDHGDSFASRIVWQAEETGRYHAAVGGYGTGTYTLAVSVLDIDDDHGNSAAAASAVAAGEPVSGSIDYEGDVDVFAFDAMEGELYQVDVALGTLPDSWAEIFGEDFWVVGYNDDYAESTASRIVWQAEGTGRYHVAVGGYGTGTYTLTLSVADVEDDHPNSAAGASPVAVGEPVAGSIDYEGDVDVFAFDAVEGEIYEIDVAPGSVDEPWVDLFWEELPLEAGEDYGDVIASTIFWQAETTGVHHVMVGAYGTGTYVLTIAVSGG